MKIRLMSKRIAAGALCVLMCVSGACAQAQSRYGNVTILKNGTQNAAVRQLQEDLKALEYYTGSVTGHYGNITQEAVRQFQKKNDLTADGIAGPRTLAALEAKMGGTSSSGGQAGTSSGTGSSSSSTLLQLDSSGDAVRALQENLTLLGYYKSSVTGHYGKLTKEAVRQFQKKNGLTADGIAGSRTLDKIFSLLADNAGKGGTGDAAGDTSGGVASGGTSSGGTPSSGTTALDTTRTLRYGSRSDDVRKLQDALAALGYFKNTSTGYYGTQTTAAVKSYQRAKGLTEDGIAGKNTLSAINADLAGGTASTTTTTGPID